MDLKQLESLINQAIKKLGCKKENNLCHYLPAPAGGYIHHFTLRKMKTECPQQLFDIINKYIVQCANP